MIIIKLQGGLGNQMFQYACAKTMAEKNRAHFYLDSSTLEIVINNSDFTNRGYELSIFNLYNIGRFYQKLVKTLCYFKFYKIYCEIDLNYDKNIHELKGNIYFNGYFQSEKYFEQCSSLIRKSLIFKATKNRLTEQYAMDIKTCTSISIHIRRGDYVSSETSNNFHGVIELDYYFTAIKYILQKVKNAMFFVFSDDCTWVQNNFVKDRRDMKIVSHNRDQDSWQDMYLMSLCGHNIIANSSFSWWGAWLNNKEGKIVIAPKQWFANIEQNNQTKDLLPDTWIKL